jgi:hypothetical protein
LFSLVVLLAFMLQSGPALSQQLTIQSETGKQIVLTRADIESLPRVRITTTSDTPATFEGVPLKTLLEKAGVTFGETLKGKRLASCLLVEAADGYRVVIALPEIDSAFADKRVLLAFLKDDRPLDQKEGPYRVVIPDEKRALSRNL